MKQNYFNDQITGKYGVSKKTCSLAVSICEQIVEKHKIPRRQIEIIEDCVVHFYLVGPSKNMLHFHITVENKGNIEYGVEFIDGPYFSIDYYQSIHDSIEYLDEFVSLCKSREIFKEFSGEYCEMKRA